MSDPSQIREGMPVLASDGERLGTVDAVEGAERIKLKRNDSPDGEHHYVPLSSVARVDEHVHLSQTASAVRSGAGWGATVAGGAAATATSTATSATGATTTGTHGASHIHIQEEEDGGGASWIPWLLGALALLALLIFGVRGCDDQERAVAPVSVEETTTTTTTATNTATPATSVRTENVVLPNGQTLAVAPATFNYDLQRYLASGDATPRTFTFDRVHFPSASAEVIPAERGDIENLGRILQAYPNARIRVVGYTDARGGANANAQLGAQRAQAVAAMLTGAGIAANRVETASGGEANPAETNATTVGQAENRRTEVVVLSK